MKQIKCAGYSIACKTGAWFLLFFTLTVTIASAATIIIMVNSGFYTRSEEEVREDFLEEILADKCAKVHDLYLSGQPNIEGVFKYDNFYYSITLADGTVAGSTYNGEEPLLTLSLYYTDSSGENGDTATVTVWGCIPKVMNETDTISNLTHWISAGYRWKTALFVFALVGLASSIIVFIYLMCAAGHKKGCDDAVPGPLDKIPFDLHTILIILINCLGVSFAGGFYYEIVTIIWCTFLLVLDYFLLVSYFMSIASRAKNGVLFRGTLTWMFLSFVWKCIKAVWRFMLSLIRNLPLLWKTILGLFTLFIWNIISMILVTQGNDFGTFLWLSSWAGLSVTAFIITLNLVRLKKGGEAIASGNLSYRLDTRNMFWEFRRHAESLNSISNGMSRAVEEQLKSERFRTELITNVSHDLKTPLTSILNYIDLIKKENPENENVRNYIDVLDRQASRLRKLTEDIVEASKASTGNLTVELAPCELGELITQTAGEYEDKLKSSGLELICQRPAEPVSVMADGRHLFRVIDNLMSNIIKYAQPSTRVYLNLERKGNKAVITFKNTSKYALNISSDELLERFVRGDASRHTEGSGLGLSIAKSLMELQHGILEITVDGDLFKVALLFETI